MTPPAPCCARSGGAPLPPPQILRPSTPLSVDATPAATPVVKPAGEPESCEEGIERAKAKGTKFGRPDRLDTGEKRKIAERYAKGETMSELAAEYQVGLGTIWRALQPASQVAA
jgi:hypothetical protein